MRSMNHGPLSSALLTVATAYADANDIELSIASRRSIGDSRVLPRLKDGVSAPTLQTADAALRWFSANWPADLAWPSDIPRPAAGSPVFAHGNGNAAVAAPDAGEAA